MSKALAIIFLVPHEPSPLLRDYLQLTLIRNPGAAFGISLGRYSDHLLLVISIAAIFMIILYYVRSSPSRWWQHFTFGLITGGAAGNLIDRLAKKEVVDFIDCGIGNLRWPVFNVADIAITLGAIFLIRHSFVYQPRKSGKTAEKHP